MNTDDNEKKLAQAAMKGPILRIARGTPGRIKPPVKRVKGFDQNTQRAEHKRKQRAKQHARRQRATLHT